jgi:hypothetical protein
MHHALIHSYSHTPIHPYTHAPIHSHTHTGIVFRPTKRFTVVGFTNEDFPPGTLEKKQWSELAFLGYKFAHDLLGVKFATVVTCGEGAHVHKELKRVASPSTEGLEDFPDVQFIRLETFRVTKGMRSWCSSGMVGW